MTQTLSSWTRIAGAAVLLAACLVLPFLLVNHGEPHNGFPGAVTTSVSVPQLCIGVAGIVGFTATDGTGGITKTEGTVSLQSTSVASPVEKDWKKVSTDYDSTTGDGSARVSGALPLSYRVVVTPTSGSGSVVDGTPVNVPAGSSAFAACVPAITASLPSTLRVGQATTVTGHVYHPDFTSPSYDTSDFSSGWADYAGMAVQIVFTTTNATTGRVVTTTIGKGTTAVDGTFSIAAKLATKLAAGVTSTTVAAIVPSSLGTGPTAHTSAGSVTVVDAGAPAGAIATPSSADTWYTGEQVTVSGSFTAQGTALVPEGARVTVKLGSTVLAPTVAGGGAVVGSSGAWTLTALIPSSAKSGTLTATSAVAPGLASAGSATGPAITVTARTVDVVGSVTLVPTTPSGGSSFVVTGEVEVTGSTSVSVSGVNLGVWKVDANGDLARTAVMTDATDPDGSFLFRFTQAKAVAGDYVILASKGATWAATSYDSSDPTTALFSFTVSSATAITPRSR